MHICRKKAGESQTSGKEDLLVSSRTRYDRTSCDHQLYSETYFFFLRSVHHCEDLTMDNLLEEKNCLGRCGLPPNLIIFFRFFLGEASPSSRPEYVIFAGGKQICLFHHTDDVVTREHGQRMRTEPFGIKNRATCRSCPAAGQPMATTIPSAALIQCTCSSPGATCTSAPIPPTVWKRYSFARPAMPAVAPPIDFLLSWRSRPPSFPAQRARLPGGDCVAALEASEPSARAECPLGHPR